jgi:hypothetical protein
MAEQDPIEVIRARWATLDDVLSLSNAQLRTELNELHREHQRDLNACAAQSREDALSDAREREG